MALADYPGYEELLARGTHLRCQVPNCKWLHEFKSLEKLEGHLKRAHNASKADLQYHWVHLDARANMKGVLLDCSVVLLFPLRVGRASHKL